MSLGKIRVVFFVENEQFWVVCESCIFSVHYRKVKGDSWNYLNAYSYVLMLIQLCIIHHAELHLKRHEKMHIKDVEYEEKNRKKCLSSSDTTVISCQSCMYDEIKWSLDPCFSLLSEHSNIKEDYGIGKFARIRTKHIAILMFCFN